jgi:mannose-6-phosphate isomerase-like protein (cupin superfamily)
MGEVRPPLVGHYELLQDYEVATASVRVFRLGAAASEAVESHVHRRSMQIYVALEGSAIIAKDGVDTLIEPYEALAVWAGSTHGARPVGESVVLMNISIPPLAADDQVPYNPQQARDQALPRIGSDYDD